MSHLTNAALSMSVALAAVLAPAQDLRLVGHFEQVRVSDATGEPHCYGHTLNLWEYRGQLLGLLNVHNGLCGDPPCGVLQNVSFDKGTGQLSFSSTFEYESYVFKGTLRRDDVRGTLNGQPLRLERDDDRLSGLDSDRSLGAWCQFWRSVRRCRDVDNLCTSLRQK